jgi:hypothetical protein
VICSAITFSLTAIIVLVHFFTLFALFFVGTKIEGIVCTFFIVLWSVIVSVETDASDELFSPVDPTVC